MVLGTQASREAISAFKELMLTKEITPSQKWNEVSNLCSEDPMWGAVAEILSSGERRQALAEYQTKRGKTLKDRERQKKIHAKEVFGNLLTDVLQGRSAFSPASARFSEIRDELAKDDRFNVVSDDATREELFLEFCEEHRKREDRMKRGKKRESEEALKSFLKEKVEAGVLTSASTW